MKIILFDIDGTLVKAGGAGKLALNKAVKTLHGAEDVCSKFYLAGGTDKVNFMQAFIEAKGRKPARKEVKAVEKKYLELLPAEVDNAVKDGRYMEIPGVAQLLKFLSKRRDVFIGLGTGNLKKGAFIKLKPSGLSKYFIFGGFGCDSYERAEVLKKAVKRAEKIAGRKARVCDVYIIGDTHKDVSAGKEAGYHTGAVTCGFGDRSKIMRTGPELVAEDFTDLSPWLIWLGLKKDPKGIKRDSLMFPDTPIEHVQYARTGEEGRWETVDGRRQMGKGRRKSKNGK